MDEERQLAETAIARGFFGPAPLDDSEDPPPAPKKYVIERPLGQGSSGSVYLARDKKLGRPVALKYLSHARPAEIERFFREARFAARLRNPAIVQIYEAAEVGGIPYIAMQYIPGGHLGSATLDRAASLRVIRQVAEALAHAHDEGIVHRDVKPANILVDIQGRGYVTDFGIARDLRAEMGATISYDGQILGTPELMAPEQARGDLRSVDARTDVYALGATLYAKLTGRPPFEGGNIVDLLHAVIHDEPALPRTRQPDIPRELEGLVLRCLRKRREERHQSMRDVIAAIDRISAGERAARVSPIWFTTYVRGRVEHAPVVSTGEPAPERDWLATLDVVQEIGASDAELYRVRDLRGYLSRLDDLIARLTGVLAERPSTGWARFYRGVAWFRRGELRKAIDDMERSIDRVGDLGGAYVELGRLYLALFLDEHRHAHRHLSQSGTDDQLQTARPRLDQAGVAFDEAQRLNHDIPRWQLRYATAIRRLSESDVEGCVAECDAILADEPDLDDVWKLKGDALRRLTRDAQPAYARALVVRRSHYGALLAMADVHLDTGALAEARQCLAHALDIHAGLVDAHALMARTHLLEARSHGRPEALHAALAEARTALTLNPECYDAQVTLADIEIERARRSSNPAPIQHALDALARAEGLDGCLQRIEWLRAQAHLVRARLTLAAGSDPSADLEAILAWRDHKLLRLPEGRRWVTLISEAERTLAEYRT